MEKDTSSKRHQDNSILNDIPSAEEFVYAGLGVFEFFREKFDDFAERGKKDDSPRAKAVKTYVEDMKKATERTREEFNKQTKSAVARMHETLDIPSQGSIDQLKKEVQQMRERQEAK